MVKLSVIMSVFNNQDTVSEAIESVLNQTFKDLELIIINDGSTDGTRGIIERYQERDSRIRLIGQENNGLTKSLNTAMRYACGEYVARQDADDISFPERIGQQVSFLERNKDIGFVGSSCKVIDEDGEFLNFVSIDTNPKKIICHLKKNNIFCHGSMMFKRELLKKVCGYREFFKYAQDYDLYLRLIELTLPGSIDNILYSRRIKLENISIQKVRLQSAYARLARRCYEYRSLKRDDSLLLKERLLEASAACGYDYILPFMQSIYQIKDNNADKARTIIRPYLFPLSVDKHRFYLLWFFTYLPLTIRSIIFNIKKNFRIIRMPRRAQI